MPTLQLPENFKILFNVRDAAKMLSVSQATIRRAVTAGRLHDTRIGDRVLFHLADLEAFAASCRVSAESSPRPRGGHPQKGGVE